MRTRQDRAANRQQRRRNKGNDHQNLLKFVEAEEAKSHKKRIRASNREVKPLTKSQARYDQSITENIITFSDGAWGSGKTWWACYRAAKALKDGDIERIIITRPAQEAEEHLGFMPGDLDEKFEPYFRPVREALEEFLGSGPLEYYIRDETIEARPLAYLRGSTFKNAFVIFDEAQNATPNQMKLFLSRIGENCTVVIDGDLEQKDIPGQSGLADAIKRLDGLDQVGFVHFEGEDIVRSGMSKAIWDRYRT
jgi:phosphate starvation-inducible protein PhoH and related proteins